MLYDYIPITRAKSTQQRNALPAAHCDRALRPLTTLTAACSLRCYSVALGMPKSWRMRPRPARAPLNHPYLQVKHGAIE